MMTRRLLRRLLPVMPLLIATLGCTAWYRDTTVLTAPIPEREPVQIFTPTGTIVAHGVRVDTTTLSYTLRIKPTDCDSCRVTIPLASVDSVRTGKVSTVRTVALFAVIVPLIILSSQDWSNY